eukprot:PhF_6_TR33440/c0_g1_i1/m.48787
MRRTFVIRQMIRRMAAKEEREMGATSDPIHIHDYIRNMTQDVNSLKGAFDNSVSKLELDKWMKAQHAAKILGIKEKDLYGIKPDNIHEAYTTLLQKGNLSDSGTIEASVAAEVLFDYCATEEFEARSRDYFSKQLVIERKKLKSQLATTNQTYINYIFLGTGFIFFGFGIVMVMGGTGLGLTDPDRIVRMKEKVGRNVRMASNISEPEAPIEPAPHMAKDVTKNQIVSATYDTLHVEVAKDVQRERDLIAQIIKG